MTMRRCLFAVAVAFALGGGACSTRDEGSTPESAVQLLLASVRAGELEAGVDRVGPRTRGHFE